jgi:hypothetical protein
MRVYVQTSALRTTRLSLILLVCTAAVCSALAPPAGAVKVKLFRHGLPRDADLKAMVAGPDGNLWFTGHQGRVVRMTPSGATTTFQLATGTALDIAAGPDGNLWIVAQPRRGATGEVVRLSPSGEARHFRSRKIDVVGASITAGADGNLWVAGGVRPYANRITPQGGITSYFLPSGDFSPPGPDALSSFGDITSGPDGNLWLVETEGWVLRLSPGGPPPPARVAVYSDETPVYNDGILTAWFACSEGSGRCAGTYTLTTRRNGRKITLIRRSYSIRAETRRKAIRFKLSTAAQHVLASGPRRFFAKASATTRVNRSSKRIQMKYFNFPRP